MPTQTQSIISFHRLLRHAGWSQMGQLTCGDTVLPVFSKGVDPVLGLVALRAYAHQGSTVNPRRKLLLMHAQRVPTPHGAHAWVHDGVWVPDLANIHSFRTPAGAMTYAGDLNVRAPTKTPA